ncbi:MAG: hypothetical protein ACJARX_000134 [Psychroserpens sp.]|jgi:hypothetical protein|uniref:HupE/UreJ family protein n=1 Tax=Psychroserpens sp. TaxID=2020870 RepID=UPI0039E64733
MTDFSLFLNEGIIHILDLDGLDHFYFIISFCILFSFKDWKKIIGLVTAFTLGHCMTLFLSGLELVTINANSVELLIPITILLSCLNNFYVLFNNKQSKQQLITTYIILLIFGLIHGLGFSNYIKMMLFDEESIILPLLGFNLGIELAQLLIVAGLLTVLSALQLLFKSKIRWIRLAINALIFLLVVMMML